MLNLAQVISDVATVLPGLTFTHHDGSVPNLEYFTAEVPLASRDDDATVTLQVGDDLALIWFPEQDFTDGNNAACIMIDEERYPHQVAEAIFNIALYYQHPSQIMEFAETLYKKVQLYEAECK